MSKESALAFLEIVTCRSLIEIYVWTSFTKSGALPPRTRRKTAPKSLLDALYPLRNSALFRVGDMAYLQQQGFYLLNKTNKEHAPQVHLTHELLRRSSFESSFDPQALQRDSI
jgi:hypothetical protein